MGFLMDGLDSEAYDRTYSDGQLVRRIAGYFRPQGRRMLLAAGAIFATAVLDTAIPIVIARSLDQLRVDTATTTIVLAAVVLALLACTSWVFNLVRQQFSARAIGDVVLKMREDAFDAVVRRDLSFYDQFATGKIVSRVNSDTQAFSQVITLTLDLMSKLLLVVFLIIYLFTVSVKLTLILLMLSPVIVGVALAFRVIARRTLTAARRMNAVVSSHIQETVSGIGVAKTFRQEPTIYAEFLDVNKQSRQVNLRTRYVFSTIFPILNTLAGVGTAALVYFGGLDVRSGVLTAGSWFLFIQGLQLFWFPLTSIASFWSQFQLGLAAGERVFALIDAEPRVVQHDNQILPEVQGDIRFKNLDFSYGERPETGDRRPELDRSENQESGTGDNVQMVSAGLRSSVSGQAAPWVLRNFDLHIRPGETLALVGHTGSGKSSIAKLVARFYEFQGGALLIDGVDIRSLDLSDYRSHLGIVTQSPFLFDGTVLENIRYGRPEASDAEVLRVARMIGNGDWIESLPNGLASEVGERGSSLSMGQRQLVALARVLLQNPSIFILDEATASIDPLTEAMIQEGLDVALRGRTAIVIAHRLSTVRHADRIIVLRQGEIIEEGNHETLLARGGHYADLYNTYFRHQSLEYIEASQRLAA
ncbi:MAG: ABC transporter ATP-binding protein/permease [Chloroflexaceae bacterium]|jgi:ABC-type multidrug transport system fused ATPase/permease subunit|nr:ABC transporter ATP-binding protein/permease [Chloroflexaceae bacterium]